MKKNERIYSLNFLKFVAMLMIVWWHFGAPSGAIDWGARMCEFLFVASGFLVGYNYFYKGMKNTWSFSCDYTHKKIRSFWPLHFLTTIILMLICFGTYIIKFGVSDIPVLFANIFLLQAWSPDIGRVCFSYNGQTWFLSALIFCYFITPFVINAVKNKKVSIVLFFFVGALRFAIELAGMKGVEIFSLMVHTSPIVRFLEYFMGMLMIPVFMGLKDKIKEIKQKTYFTIIWTFVEIGLIALIVFLMYKFNSSWLRAYYVYIFCFLIFFMALDCGYFSKICAIKPITYICSFQLEIYLLQNVSAKMVTIFVGWIGISQIWIWRVMFLIVIFGLSILYKTFIEEKFAKCMDYIYGKVKNLFVSKTEQTELVEIQQAQSIIENSDTKSAKEEKNNFDNKQK